MVLKTLQVKSLKTVGTANFAVLDENLDLVETILNGNLVWLKGKGVVR